ncbi:PAP2-domain-containing protein [Cylindrobasidium torrendii FP15055 ss-10]|uniref:PAP2-domain-containing protein n=1 Tax=Cylindrobasidium torrendii FP15055 ss-10 TaxID=1314674 RepID=A0A0D7AV94_9AGAR|nr:PAP2-domain-containing protein [Cylindrobasidium torrendii FP15055 ss-10]
MTLTQAVEFGAAAAAHLAHNEEESDGESSLPDNQSNGHAESSLNGHASIEKRDRTTVGSEEEYDKCLPEWRARLRRKLIRIVNRESILIGALQRKIHNPLLDLYFTYSSILGTDYFFILSLPMFFFFGYDDLGRGLLIILGIGGYMSVFLKDLICSPRPFSPPVQRLNVLNHHMEYGFPSTHTVHCSSIVLYFCLSIPTLSTTSSFLLGIYAFTITFGRIYLGMHTFTDVAVGLVVGTTSVTIQRLPITQAVEASLFQGDGTLAQGLFQPRLWTLFTSFLATLELIPMPMDDCPCYDDAVLSGAVALGALLGRSALGKPGLKVLKGSEIMPGSGWAYSDAQGWTEVPPNAVVWWGAACAKMIIGIFIVFLWRAAVKAVMKRIWRSVQLPAKIVKGVGGKAVFRQRMDTYTKVIVYTGIAVLSCDVTPLVFAKLGLGIQSWPSSH